MLGFAGFLVRLFRARAVVVLACVAAMLCTANFASAHPDVQTKTRVWDFESAAPLNTRLAALASQQTRPENQPPYCGTRVSFPSRSRVWSPQLGAFLEADEFGFLTRTGTLWSWPGQNPLRWRDPSGRCAGLAVGAAALIVAGSLIATADSPDSVADPAAAQETAMLGGMIAGIAGIAGLASRMIAALSPAAQATGVGLLGAMGQKCSCSDAGGVPKMIPQVAQLQQAKHIALPAWRKVTVDMTHILERHVPGAPFSAGRDVFPSTMNATSIERAIRAAYESSTKTGVQGMDRVLLQGQGSGLTIEMWFNKATNIIETAYPITR